MKRINHLVAALAIVCIAATFSNLQAQKEYTETQSAGSVNVKGKKSDDGVIMLKSAVDPWENQRTVRYISERGFNKKKVKKKDWDKYKPKDIKGYTFGDRKFVVEKYTALGSTIAATNVNKVTAATSLIGSASKNKHFMEILLDGKVKVYRFYNYPPETSAQSGSDQINAFAEMKEDLRNNYEILVKVSNGKKAKVKNFRKVNLKELLGDCPEVSKAYANGEYELKPSGVKKLAKLTDSGPQLESKVLELMKAYNECY